jgi:hypothetical protein
VTGARVIAVACGAGQGFSKPCLAGITLVAGLGVAGDAHAGVTVRHRSRLASTPDAPNLRQVHLLHAELFDELEPQGFVLAPGDIGENLLTWRINLLGLPNATRLQIGADAEVEITGLRNPCHQLDRFRPRAHGGDTGAGRRWQSRPQGRGDGNRDYRWCCPPGRSDPCGAAVTTVPAAWPLLMISAAG